MAGEEAVIRSPAQVGQMVQTLRRERQLSQRLLALRAGGISQAKMSVLELHPERLALDRLLLITAALELGEACGQSRLCVAAIRCHSAFTFSLPSNRKRRMPRASWICPFTGSTIALRRA